MNSTEHQGSVTGTLSIPVSKYHVHRALVLAGLADGVSILHGVSHTRQAEWTIACLRALGVGITVTKDAYIVTGTGGRFRSVPIRERGSDGGEGLLDVGASGTTLYFLTGLACLADSPITLTGMKYFRRRPIKALLDSLQQMGVELSSEDDCPPITVQPGRPRGGDVEIAGTLSQWISGLLLLAPFAETDTTIHVTGGKLNEGSYVDLTLRLMRHWGLDVEVSEDELTYRIPAGQTPKARDYTIPADIGSAAFGIAAAALHPADVLLEGLTTATSAEADHPEAEFLDIVTEMGVPLTRDPETGWVRIHHDGLTLQPFDLDATTFPDLVPVLSALACFADGTSHLRNVGHARLKESDRVAAMLQVNRLGGHAEQEATALHITGIENGRGTGAALSSFNDHRVLMALAVAATRCQGVTSLTYPHAYRTSYPEFLDAMESIGLSIGVGSDPRREKHSEPARGTEPALESAPRHPEEAVPHEDAVFPRLVRERAERSPEEAAVIEVAAAEAASTTSWAELQEEADRISQMLIELGTVRGDAIAVQLPNWREFVAVSLGAMQIGAVVTPIMPVFGPREVCMTLVRSKAKILFLPDLFRGRRAALELLAVADEAEATGRKLALENIVVVQSAARGGEGIKGLSPIPEEAAARWNASDWTWRYYDRALASVTPDRGTIADRMPSEEDICQLLFTSGTTGEPKGVQHPYRTLGQATSMHVARSGLGSEDRIFVPSPLAHQTGFLYGMLLAFRLGVAQVIQPIWSGEKALDQAFEQAKVSFVQAATPFLMDLVGLVESGQREAPESLTTFVATGAAVPRELAQRATKVLETSVLGAFGTTETCLATLSGPADVPESIWGTDGRALPGITLRIVDDEGHEVPAGVEGNFEFASPTLFGGYLERSDLTAEVFTDDDFYRTGDLAVIDENGYLKVTGRVKDIINRGGEKIPVSEIENLLFRHPLVADVALVAMPDPRLGERGCAYLVDAQKDRTLDLSGIQEYLSGAGVSKYYWPERVEHIDEMPRNASGKIQKNVLREAAAALAADGRDGRKES
ncbi:3-phosphoshikimate 1-carboxyvinyltransferase [Rothia uropygioeca]|uniref:3-phosphoshikimate 1-carboxyvinyltransferase n=1 Tax=Kocuria sp. 257 TaxID=2021970 RepID=UPI00192D2101|nr:3-phosphoshikimate 1-carboxyvinyltransferase [Kocuria sp. 257]